jgi:hypothetical protein
MSAFYIKTSELSQGFNEISEAVRTSDGLRLSLTDEDGMEYGFTVTDPELIAALDATIYGIEVAYVGKGLSTAKVELLVSPTEDADYEDDNGEDPEDSADEKED